MVIPPARTGRESKSKKAVKKAAQQNILIISRVRPAARMLEIEVMKFKAPIIEDIPAIWREKMAKSTAKP